MTFIKRGVHDSKLQDRLNAAQCILDRDEILADENMPFSQLEFEEAYRNRLTLCKEEVKGKIR
jgi:hypothetical protein